MTECGYSLIPAPSSGLSAPDRVKSKVPARNNHVSLAFSRQIQPNQNLYRLLLGSEEFADVKFLVDGEEITAHKFVLATRCFYFKMMFEFGMMESTSNTIVIGETKPAVFRELLRFIYTDDLPEYQSDVSMDLLRLADQYGLRVLKDWLLEAAVGENLSSGNVMEALRLSEHLDCEASMSRAI